MGATRGVVGRRPSRGTRKVVPLSLFCALAGSEMVLLRLTDAEKELAGYDGLRVHRSWWVARKHVTKLKRDGDRQVLEISNGEEIPVSRSYAKRVREALTN
ncbi:MAG: LytTR family DNA-binding domain-containing protein [Rhizobiaceae bacterium]